MTLTCTCGGPCEELSIGSPIDAATTFRCGTCRKRYRVVDCQLADLLKREREAADAVSFLRSEITELDRMLAGLHSSRVLERISLQARREQVAGELHFRTIAPQPRELAIELAPDELAI